MDKMIETGFAKGCIVPRQLHHGFGFAFGAVHDGYGSYEPSEMNANGNAVQAYMMDHAQPVWEVCQ
jgi:hypothetical protein